MPEENNAQHWTFCFYSASQRRIPFSHPDLQEEGVASSKNGKEGAGGRRHCDVIHAIDANNTASMATAGTFSASKSLVRVPLLDKLMVRKSMMALVAFFHSFHPQE